jgi:hypothetical protein
MTAPQRETAGNLAPHKTFGYVRLGRTSVAQQTI